MPQGARTSLGEMQARGILGRRRTHPRIRMQNDDAGEDKLWGEANQGMAASLHLASGLVFHTLPGWLINTPE